jgi:hypothetical protein
MEQQTHDKLLEYSTELETGDPKLALQKMCAEFSVQELEELESLIINLKENVDIEEASKYPAIHSALLLIAIKSAIISKNMHNVQGLLKTSDKLDALKEATKGYKGIFATHPTILTFRQDLTTMALITIINFSSFLLLMHLIS